MLEKVVCNWRVFEAQPSGLMLWFDPSCEVVRLYRLPPPDGEEVGDEALELDEGGKIGDLDKIVSVSASGPDRASGDNRVFKQLLLFDEEEGLPF